MIINSILIFLGAFFFLFAFWRRLKEDYFENQIFTTGFYIFFFVTIANIVGRYIATDYWFWLSYLGLLLGTILGSMRFKMRFFEVLEATVVASFTPTILFLLYDGIRLASASSFFAIAGITLLIGMYYFLTVHYKRISWYRSGKIGFSGLAVLGTFFLARAVVAVVSPNVVSLVYYDWILSSIAAFLTFLVLVHLSLKKS